MLTLIALQLVGDPEERSVDGGAIIVGQLDDARLDDKTAEFDQMSGALAALDLPSAHVMPSQCRLVAIAGYPIALERRAGFA